MKKDNASFRQKAMLRRSLLKQVDNPIVLEAYGGMGKLFTHCYADIQQGVVMEKDGKKTTRLAEQRPTWSVYEGDTVAMLAAGAGKHLPINFIDLDPYGDPWPALDAFFESRDTPETVYIAVTDGLRQKVQLKGAWTASSLEEAVRTFGNDLYPIYLEVCEWMMNRKAATFGYSSSSFSGYYVSPTMAHYASIWSKDS